MILEQKLPDNHDLSVEASNIELVILEESASSLSLVFPPAEDLSEIESLKLANFSLKTLIASHRDEAGGEYAHELGRLLQKEERFSTSPVFFNRLANLAKLSGRLELEAEYLQRAVRHGDGDIFSRKIAENFISRGMPGGAEDIFLRLDLNKDIHANLRLAYFSFARGEFSAAKEALKRANEIDSFDYNVRLFEGAIKFVEGDYSGALRSYRIAESDRPNSSVLQANAALAYIKQGLHKKALSALKRSVVFDPLNENAVCLLADLSFSLGKSEDVIPALRYFLEYEQRDAKVWSRLARGLISVGAADEAVAALKRQASISDSISVWNNLGVAYYQKGAANRYRAYQSFKHAVTRDEGDWRDSAIAVKNLCYLLSEDKQYEDVIKLTAIATADEDGRIISDKDVSDLYSLQISAATDLKRYDLAERLALGVVESTRAHSNVIAWAASWLIAQYGLDESRMDEGLAVAARFKNLI
ncbi:MAG: hypothetical protein K0Q68_2146, partial [Moraxellaceae bacterium]|nr:hypothetical protein [Moraxellaceae bacterium]